MTILTGRCHCGAISVSLETDIDPAALELRACGCSFCRKHGGDTVSDPAGHVRFSIAPPDKLKRYQFGLKTADFLLCAECGVYLGAYMEHGGKGYAVVNVNALDDRRPFERAAQAMNYGDEGSENRIERRLLKWTPAAIAAV